MDRPRMTILAIALVVVFTLTACQPAPPSPTRSPAPLPDTATPGQSKPTPTLDPLMAKVIGLAAHPCAMIPDYAVSNVFGMADVAPTEETSTDPTTGDVVGLCTYEGVVVITLYAPLSVDSLRETFDSRIDSDWLDVDPGNPRSMLWDTETSTLMVLAETAWYSIRVLVTDGDLLLMAVDLSSTVRSMIPEPSDLLPTSTPRPVLPFIEPCDLVTQAEAEDIVGSISNFPGYVFGSQVTQGQQVDCSFFTEEKSFLVGYAAYTSAGDALADYRVARDRAESATDQDGLGDEAFVVSPTPGYALFRLTVLQGAFLVFVEADDRQTAIALAEIALGRLSGDTPMPTPLPTQAPTPTFDACDAFSTDQIESLIGPLTGEPQLSGSVGEGVGYFVDCTYQSKANFVIVSYTHFATAQGALHILGEPGEGEESIAGLGDRAKWNESMMTMCAVNEVLYVCITGLPRKEAIEGMDIVLVRIPVR